MATQVEVSRTFLRETARMVTDGAPNSGMYSAMAKRYVTDECFDVVNQALQLFGGYGYLKDYPIEKYFRDLRVHQILEGSNEIMLHII